MPRQKTGNPLGRPPLYQDDERPVTVSLRIPHDLAAQMKRYASLHRQSVTELLLDGLKWRIGVDDPRDLAGAPSPLTAHDENKYYGNAEMSPTVLEEIREALAHQNTQLHALTQALEQRVVVAPPETYNSNTVNGEEGHTGYPAPEATEYNENTSSAMPAILNTEARNITPREPDNARPVPARPRAKRTTLAQVDVADLEAMPLVPVASAPPPAALEDKAAVLAQLATWKTEGVSLQQMADHLNAAQVQTFSGKGQWKKGTIGKLLTSSTTRTEA
jgi:hypothetical protein